MPSSRELRGLDLAQALTRGFGRFSQGYGEGQGEEEQIRRQEFMTAGEAAGQPVTSLPARGGGLLGDVLRGLHIAPGSVTADPQDIAAQKNAIEDRQLARLLAVSQLAGRIDPQGIAALAKLPGMEKILGGVTPDIASHFITPADMQAQARQEALQSREQQNQFMNQERTMSREDREANARVMQGIAAENAATRQETAGMTGDYRQFMMEESKRRNEEQENYHVNTLFHNRISQAGMTNPTERAAWVKAQGYYDENRGMGLSPLDAFNNAVTRVKTEAAAPSPSGGDSTLSKMLGGFGFGGSYGAAAPTAPGGGAGALPPLPW